MKKKLFFIFFIVSFLFSFYVNIDRISVPYFGGLNKKILLDVKYKNFFEKNKKNIFFDGHRPENILKINDNHYLYSLKNYKSVNEIKIENSKNIDKIIIYADKEAFFINSSEILGDNFIINTKKMSQKNFYNRLAISLLSFFYNFNYFIICYLILFFAFLKFSFYEKKFLYLMIFLTVFLRLAQLNSIPFWDDEIYTIKITELNLPLNLLFCDLGNPPLYFILFKIFRLLVQDSHFWRLLPVILGSIFNIVFYIYLKRVLNIKVAKIGFFIVTFNIVLIYFSQELRCYMLLMLLGVASSLFLFSFKGRNKIYYLFSSMMLLYTHFYGTFLVLYNFIFGFFFCFKKRKKIDFLKINLLSLISFLPLLIFKKEGLTNDFNSWLKKPDWIDIKLVFETFSGKVFFFLIFLIICFFALKFIKKRKEKIFVLYNFFAILFVFFASIIFSFLIKPIFCYRYFYIVYPCYIALISYFAACNWKFRLQIVLKFLFIIFLGLYSRVNYQNLFCNHNIYLKFIQNDIDYNVNNYIFMTDTVEGYSKFENIFKGKNNVEVLYLPVNKGMKEIDFHKYGFREPYCVYVLNLYLKDDVFENASDIVLYKTPLGVFSKTVFKK